MKLKTILLSLSILATLNLNADKTYSMEYIYNHMCIECHHSDGSGNTDKLTPSMRDLSQKEIREALEDIENDKGHIIMEHNRGEIIKMGMKYKADKMAQYMHKRFHQK